MSKEEGEEGVWGITGEGTRSHEKAADGWSPRRGGIPTPRSHLLPTGVEKVSQPHDIAVVQLTHNLQLSVLGGQGKRASEDKPLSLPPLLSTPRHSSTPIPASRAKQPLHALAPRPHMKQPLIPHP